MNLVSGKYRASGRDGQRRVGGYPCYCHQRQMRIRSWKESVMNRPQTGSHVPIPVNLNKLSDQLRFSASSNPSHYDSLGTRLGSPILLK
jgi:hypothetical protein